MQNTRFILLNGPKSSGRSTIAREMAQFLVRKHVLAVTDTFAAPAKHFFATALGQQYAQMPKDAPRAELTGRSIHEAMIDLCEMYCKQEYGDDIFGRWLYHRMGRMNPSPSFVIVSDCGFEAERIALGKDKCIVVHVKRGSSDFSDSVRSYLEEPNVIFDNSGEMVNVWLKSQQLAEAILGGHIHPKIKNLSM